MSDLYQTNADPLMNPELTQTQLDFARLYEPPLGAVGKAVNAIISHRIAEVSVHECFIF